MQLDTTGRGRMGFKRTLRKYWWFYLMLVPGLLYFLVFKYLPMYGVLISFKNYSIFKDFSGSPWVGFENFTKLFGRVSFQRALVNNIIISVMKLLFGFPLPIILSLMLNEMHSNRLKRGVQTAIILPNFISWIVINGLMYALFNTNSGALLSVMRLFGYTGAAPNILTDKEHFRWVILISYLWKSGGYGTIIYLAAIAGIDQSLYEAAEIDGAGRLKLLWHVTLAGLRPTIIILLIFRVGEMMNAGFDQIYAISNYLVVSVSEIIDTYVYKLGMENRKFSEAAAAGLFQNVIGMTLVLVTNWIARRVDPESGII